MAAERPISAWRLTAALAPAMVVPFLGSLIYFVAFSGEPWARSTYVLIKLFTLVWPLLATRWILRRSLPQIDCSAEKHRRALGLGALLGIAIVALVVVLMVTGLEEMLLSFAPQVRRKVVQLGVLNHYLAFALFLSVAHSGLEEYYWRWFLFGNLRRALKVPAAAAVGSAAFTSHHVVILSQYVSTPLIVVGSLAVWVGGLLLCWMYQSQKTLTGAWLAHFFADVAVLWVGYRLLF